MIKYFCDLCKKETSKNVVSNRFVATRGGAIYKTRDGEKIETPSVSIECIVTIDKVANHGELCGKCLKEIIAGG